MIRIELTRAILMRRFSNFLRNLTIHFRMFLYSVTCFQAVTVSLLCQLQAVSKLYVTIYPYLISEGRWNCSTLWPAQQRNRDSGNMLANINTCENGWSNISENLRIVVLILQELTRFSSPNQSIYITFVHCWGPVVMLTF